MNLRQRIVVRRHRLRTPKLEDVGLDPMAFVVSEMRVGAVEAAVLLVVAGVGLHSAGLDIDPHLKPTVLDVARRDTQQRSARAEAADEARLVALSEDVRRLAVLVDAGVVLDELQASVDPVRDAVGEAARHAPAGDGDLDALAARICVVQDVDDEGHAVCRHAAGVAAVLAAVREALAVLVDGLEVGLDADQLVDGVLGGPAALGEGGDEALGGGDGEAGKEVFGGPPDDKSVCACVNVHDYDGGVFWEGEGGAVWLLADMVMVGTAEVVDVIGGDHVGHGDVVWGVLVMLLQKRSSGEVQVDDSGAYMCKQRQPACEETAGI
jgi:hypothetical protein